MSILNFFKRPIGKNSASLAKERLQIIIAHQRGRQTEYLPLLQKELLEVISKYVEIDEDQVKVELENNGECSVLELNITLPEKSNLEAPATT
jgi:cell division topological specificity factor